MKIINLVEDTKSGNCLNEHGLSFYIETGKHKLLVDSGATDMFLHNADLLGIDLKHVDTAVLSHGHYDHSGGLTAFELQKTNSLFYTGHCTGQNAFDIMKEIMGDKLQIIHSGSQLDIQRTF